ncbi:sensor domain-containing diguanylate cyclase [Sedimentibacter sp. MB31-C6]|uniref:sensor domain-containing diguanylate cyclase n=1 Tax=Sedimentibacter sp. MB31-C6 TaxID=3109366 RepID=UPI002DDD4B21|nr:GGDEF domain-containing protein [Sedimentibacter sp. MB36-C1]WSI02890.1 GGDEF domain-containing protein [Sedimentibacter sp. MB36-C1]
MIDYFNYISDVVIKCKIVQKDNMGEIDLKVLFANKQIQNTMGVSSSEIINKNLTDVIPKLSNSIFHWPKILSEAAMTSEHKVIEQYVDAFEKYLKFNIFGYKEECFFITIQDVTEKKDIKRKLLERDRQIKHLEDELKSKANIDMLTKLYNFQFVTDSIYNSIESYKEEGINFCVLLIDIDNFKGINKKYGIKNGDAVLQNVANTISSLARKIDVVGRYGNDKFILLLNSMDAEIAKIMVERLKQDIKRHSANLDGIEVSVCGTLIEYHGESEEELLEKIESNIDKAMSIGKGTIIS